MQKLKQIISHLIQRWNANYYSMISISEKRRKNRSTHKEQLTLYQLGLLRDALDTEENRASQFKQQIKLQKTQGNKVIKNINNNIGKLENNAVNFSQKMQQQQIMNETLEKLVKFYENSIYQNKVDKYQDEKNKIETDKYTEAKHSLMICEKNLEKLLIKANSADYENKKKIDQVRTLRGERAVFSNLLDKIQRQNFQLQLLYKQLVIERVLNEKIQSSNLQDLKKLEEYYTKIIEAQQNNHEKQEQSMRNEVIIDASGDEGSPKKKSVIKFNTSNFTQFSHSPNKVKRLHKKDMEGTKIIRSKTQQKQTRKLQFQKRLKQIFFDLGVDSLGQIMEKKENLLVQLQYAYDRANAYYDKINEYQAKIQQIHNHKTTKELKSHNSPPDKIKSMQERIYHFDKAISSEVQDINKFTQSLQILQKGYTIIGEGQVIDRVMTINYQILKMTPLYIHQKKASKRQSNGKLNMILNSQSPQFKNCMQIFNEEELIKMSKESLNNMESKRMSMAPTQKEKSHRTIA